MFLSTKKNHCWVPSKFVQSIVESSCFHHSVSQWVIVLDICVELEVWGLKKSLLAECSAPKNEFTMANATVDEVWDPTKSGSASSNN